MGPCDGVRARIHIDGGASITLDHPITRQTHGDGIYVGYQPGKNTPPVGIIINDADIKFAARNGIASVAGQVTIYGGQIDRVGLHGIDFEPNDASGAASIRGYVEGVDIRHHGDLATGHRSYAVAAIGRARQPVHSVRLRTVTGDVLSMSFHRTARVSVRDSTSRRLATAAFSGSTSVHFVDNVRIRRR